MSNSSLIVYRLIFFSFLIALILSQDQNHEETKPSNNNDSNPTKDNSDEDTNKTYEYKPRKETYNKQHEHIDKEHPYNLTYDEMDTMMFCSILIQESIQKKKKEIEDIIKKLNSSSSDQVYDKIGTDIFEYCTKNVDINIVNKYIKNLYYSNNFKWEKSFDSLTQINSTKYNNKTDLYLTQNQRILMFLFEKVNELFRQKRADQTVDFQKEIQQENQKIKIGNFDMNNIPIGIKLGIFLIVIIVLFGGVFYFLKKMEKKPKDKKKNKKKKTE